MVDGQLLINMRYGFGPSGHQNMRMGGEGVEMFGQSLSPNREGGWSFLTEKQVKNRLSNHLGIIVFVTDRQVGTFSERNR